MRKVVITGVSRGIGAATARLFLKQGYAVYGIDRIAPSENCGLSRFELFDLSCVEDIPSVVESLLGSDLALDALVNDAAVQNCETAERTSVVALRSVLDVNLLAPMELTRCLTSRLARAEGAVVNVASVHALATSVGIAAYAASKGALVAWTRAASLELAACKVRVNAVAPGAVDTTMLREGLMRGAPDVAPDDRVAAFATRHPLGRVGTPEDIARAIEFLVDRERSGFVTGTTLVVDGGVTARLSSEADL